MITDEIRENLRNPQYVDRGGPDATDVLTVYDEIPGASGRPVCLDDEVLFLANPEWDKDTIWSVFEYGEDRFSEGRKAERERVKGALMDLVK